MTREYFAVRAADIDKNTDGEHYLARTVYEPDETYDIGLVDAAGNKILAREKRDPIGFVRHDTKGI